MKSKLNLDDFTLDDLREMRTVLTSLLGPKRPNLKDTFANLAKNNPVKVTHLKKLEAKFRRRIGDCFQIDYVEKVRGNELVVTEELTSAAKVLVEALERFEAASIDLIKLGKASTDRGNVRIASILSVVNYLGPALIASLQAIEKQNGEDTNKTLLIPSIQIIYGEVDLHLKLLQNNELDFFLARDVDVSLSKVIDKRPLPLRARNRGLVFRLNSSDKRVRAFPDLIEALQTGDSKSFRGHLAKAPLIIVARLDLSRPDPFVSELYDMIHKVTRTDGTGLVFTVPTIRTERQFVQMGLGVGFSHSPLQPRNSQLKLSKEFKNSGAIIGTDSECPDADLVYVPLSFLGSTGLGQENIRFAIYYRRCDTTAERGDFKNADMSDDALLVANEIVAITNGIRGDFGYLSFDNNELLVDFHFGGSSLYLTSNVKGIDQPLPPEQAFARNP